jgi:hypothetical protein
MIVGVLVVVFSALFIWYSRYTGEGFWVYTMIASGGIR